MTITNVRHLYAAGLNKPAVDALLELEANADAKIKTYVQASAPTGSDLRSGDLWIDSDDDNHPYRYDGSSWVSMRDGTIATAQTSADNAQTQADYSGHRGIGDSAVFKTDASGTQPTNNTTRDLVAQFLDETGAVVATRTLRGTYTTAADTIAVTAQSTTGETTTYTVNNDGTDAPSATVVHSASEAVAVLSWVFSDLTSAGVDPNTGGGK